MHVGSFVGSGANRVTVFEQHNGAVGNVPGGLRLAPVLDAPVTSVPGTSNVGTQFAPNVAEISLGGIANFGCGLLPQPARAICEGASDFLLGGGDAGCQDGFQMVGNDCVPGTDIIPGPTTAIPGAPSTSTIPGSPNLFTPAERGPGVATGAMVAPSAVCVNTLRCPRFADGKTGILWFSPLTNAVVCLPRGTNGRGFGLIRKNPKRKPAIISAADGKLFRKVGSMKKKVQRIAKVAGLKGCTIK